MHTHLDRWSALAMVVLGAACGAPMTSEPLDAGGTAGGGAVTDAGPSDAGAPVDASVPLDAGVSTDAGVVVDAGTVVDAGLSGPMPVGCVTTVAAGHHALRCDGITWELEVSPACARGGCGLVVDVHGLTMNGNSQDKSTKLRSLGPPRGFVIAQPTAPSSALGPSWTPASDDPKVWAFLQQLRTALVIDPKRVHMTGFSQGGAMTWRMLCAHADVFASVAPIAAADAQSLSSNSPPFALDCPFTPARSPSREVPVLQMHGASDGLVPIAKGQQQRDAVVAAWNLGAPMVVSSDAQHTRTRYTSASGLVFEYLQHSYAVTTPYVPVPLAGHCIPGGDDLRANGALGQTMFFSCAPPNAFAWGQVVLQFFVDHPKP